LFYLWYNRANIKLKLEKYSEAIDDYSKAIDLKNEFGDAYFNRAINYLYLSDTTNACLDLGKAGELGNSDVYPLIRNLCK